MREREGFQNITSLCIERQLPSERERVGKGLEQASCMTLQWLGMEGGDSDLNESTTRILKYRVSSMVSQWDLILSSFSLFFNCHKTIRLSQISGISHYNNLTLIVNDIGLVLKYIIVFGIPGRINGLSSETGQKNTPAPKEMLPTDHQDGDH